LTIKTISPVNAADIDYAGVKVYPNQQHENGKKKQGVGLLGAT